jgi:hypothetical protein
MTGPGDEVAAAEGRERSGLRASDADREQVTGALKAAFVQGRLTRDELGARAGRVYASPTYAELAEVIADIPTAIAGAQSARPPWRATKRAWWFEYAVFLPGIVAIIFLPGGPRTTVWTLVILAAVVYPAFWALGVLFMVGSRRAKLSGGQQLPPSWYDREQVTCTLRAAMAQGRLTEKEHDARAVQASGAGSRAELAALTADLPADLTARLPTARYAWTGICASIAAVSVVAAILVWQPDNFLAFALALFAAATVILAPPITVGLIIDAHYQKRTGGQLRLGEPSARAS